MNCMRNIQSSALHRIRAGSCVSVRLALSSRQNQRQQLQSQQPWLPFIITKSISRSLSTSRTMAQEYKLKVDDVALAPGQKQEVEIEGLDGAKILMVNIDGDISAVAPRCTHYGAPLVKGVLTPSGRLTCPWHGACFNAKTGDVEDAPALDALPTFSITSKDGAWYVSGDADALKSGHRAPKLCSASDSPDKVLVVGGGSGTLGLVQGLREKGYSGAVIVISAEGYHPIDRPKLSKSLMTDLSKLTWRDDKWFKINNVEWINGEVVDVDLAAKAVTTKNGDRHTYTKLVLATGGKPKNLPLQGFKTLENIFTLRTVHDAVKINKALGEKGKKVVIVGSSFIGMELAVVLSKEHSVSVIGMENVPLERVLGEAVGAGIQSSLESKGIKFYMSAGVDKAEPSTGDAAKVGSVALKDGTSLDADIVVLGVGVAPATDFLRDNAALRLERDGSIKTDKNFAVTGASDVYAIGDIATYPYHGPGGDGQYVRIEHWNVAQNAGRAVATNIASPTPCAPSTHDPSLFIPVFWSALGSQLRYCGSGAVGSGWDDLVLDGDVAAAKFVAYYCRGETVLAVASMGRDPVVMKAMELMRQGKMPAKSELSGLNLLKVAL
jgi:NADPH-dependent 2,4-dienoyl-CoA reductase/sulfur reductase-like enzyme/nitrite reductase/ring-hydroxylating ferredoxin subunit